MPQLPRDLTPKPIKDAYEAVAIGFQTVMSRRERTSHVEPYDFTPALKEYHAEIQQKTTSSQQYLLCTRLDLEKRTAKTITEMGDSRGFILREPKVYSEGAFLARRAVADFYGIDPLDVKPKYLDVMQNGATRPLRFVVVIEGMPVEVYFKKYSPVRVPHAEIHNMLSGLPRLSYKTDGDIILEEAVRGEHKTEFDKSKGVSLDQDLEFLLKRAQGLAYAVVLGTKDLLHGTPRNPRLSLFNDRNYKVTSTKSITLFDFDKIGGYTPNELREIKRMLVDQGISLEDFDNALRNAKSRVNANLRTGNNLLVIQELSEVIDSAWDWLTKQLGESPAKFASTRDLRMVKEYFSWFVPSINDLEGNDGC